MVLSWQILFATSSLSTDPNPLYLSRTSDDFDRLKGYQAGAVDYISVPIVPELLRAKVSVFVELHRRAQQLEALNGELCRLSSSLIAMQDEERRRIARELHDSLGQELAAAKMAVDGTLLHDHLTDSMTKLAMAEASAMIDRAIQQVRSISHLLHPPLHPGRELRSP